jgi:hypothetical protein
LVHTTVGGWPGTGLSPARPPSIYVPWPIEDLIEEEIPPTIDPPIMEVEASYRSEAFYHMGHVIQHMWLDTTQSSNIDRIQQTFEDGGIYTERDARDNFPDIAAKYPQLVKETLRDYKPIVDVTPYPLRAWQQELNLILNRKADSRAARTQSWHPSN